MEESGYPLQDQEQRIEEEGRGSIQALDATSVGKGDTSHGTVMRFGDNDREIGTGIGAVIGMYKDNK